MDDIGSALGAILGNPQTMQQIMSLASQLGMGDGPPPETDNPSLSPPPSPSPPAPALQPAYTPAAYPPPPPSAGPAANPLSGLDMNMLAKAMQMMGSLNQHDQNVDLLLALKPHFGEKRRKKVDDAIRMMQLVKMLPMLKEAGLFGSLFEKE